MRKFLSILKAQIYCTTQSIPDKIHWCHIHLPNVPVIIETNKYIHASKNSILIDDLKSNIDKWNEIAGSKTGILHKNAFDTIKKLKKFGL
jgi:hypothetical protein